MSWITRHIMYHSTRLNALIIAGSVIGGLVMFLFIRQDTGVSDRQFLRSASSGAILMCEGASLQDAEDREFWKGIIAGQQREIVQMVAKLRDLER